jgi:peptide/nickel transport system permease protein
MSLLRLILAKLLGAIGVLFAASLLVFYLGSKLVPGDEAYTLVGSMGATPAQLKQIKEKLGLNDSLPVQYWHWLSGVFHGNFGSSPLTHIQVGHQVASQIPVSFELVGLSILGATVIGIPLGVAAAARANRAPDVVLRSGMLVILGVPSFLFGVVLLYTTARYWPFWYSDAYVPVSQSLSTNLRYMVVPALVIALPTAAMVMQMTRASILETVNQPFVLAARARGVSAARIRFRHVLKNALGPVVTLLGFEFATLLGSVVVVEQIFGLPGLGQGLVSSVGQREWDETIAITLVIAATFIVSNLVVGALNALLDPRQRKA